MSATTIRKLVQRWTPNRWNSWPDRAYQRECYQQRLALVEQHLSEAITLVPAGPLQILSICAGDGRDVIHTVQSHPRRGDVHACLVELSSESVALGIGHTKRAALSNHIRFINDDATDCATYRSVPPADIVLVCGVWGHVPKPDRPSLMQALASFSKPGGYVLWTRGTSKGAQQLQAIQSLFATPEWDELRFSLTPDKKWAVVTQVFQGAQRELPQSGRIFNFQTAAGR